MPAGAAGGEALRVHQAGRVVRRGRHGGDSRSALQGPNQGDPARFRDCGVVRKVTTVALVRRFYEWREDADGLAQSRYRAAAGLSDGLLGWSDLLAKRRVVILAEAGSGKTEELKERARLQTIAGNFAFYATVQDVGRDGLDTALRPADRGRLNAWRSSSEPGWFFIDSIDEAKLDNTCTRQSFGQDILVYHSISEQYAPGRTRWHAGIN